jgi:hypothetical protein
VQPSARGAGGTDFAKFVFEGDGGSATRTEVDFGVGHGVIYRCPERRAVLSRPAVEGQVTEWLRKIFEKLCRGWDSQVLGVDTHQAQDFHCLSRQHFQGFLHGLDQLDELCEIAIVCGFGFDFLPQVLNWIVIGRVRRQLVDNQMLFVLFKELSRGFTGVIPSAILDEDDLARDL